MAVATKSIILEDVLEDIFSYLPEMAYKDGQQKYPVVFGYGDEVELNAWLAAREVSQSYPLIWLLYPYKETHTNTKLVVDQAVFILAMDTNKSMQYKERVKTTYNNVLMPLFFNLRSAFKKANIINTASEYDIIKYPNYSKSDDKQETGTIDVWDALRVTTGFSVIDTCLKPIKF